MRRALEIRFLEQAVINVSWANGEVVKGDCGPFVELDWVLTSFTIDSYWFRDKWTLSGHDYDGLDSMRI